MTAETEVSRGQVRLRRTPVATAVIRLVPPFAFLAGLLFLRTLADAVTDVSVGAAIRINLAALLGLAAIAYAALLLATTLTTEALKTAVIVVAAVAAWGAVALIIHGYDVRILREAARIVAVVAVGVIVANAWDVPPTRVAGLVAACLVIPIGVAIVQFGLNVGNFGPQGTPDFFRVSGTFVQANKAAQVFVLAAATGLWLTVATRRHTIGAAILIGSLVALLGTRSMGGLVALVVAALAFILLGRLGRSAKVAVVAVVAVSLVVFAVSPLGASRLESLADTRLPWDVVGLTTNSLEWRLYNWWLFLEEWLRHPFVGHGLGATQTAVQPLGQVTHSDLMRALVETGVLGVLGLSVAVGVAAVAIRRTLLTTATADSETATLTRIVVAVLIGLGVQSTVQNTSANTALLFLLMALVVSLLAEDRRRRREPPSGER